MRNTMSLLSEYRQEAIKQEAINRGLPVPTAKLAETRQAFEHIDRHLSGFASGRQEARMAEAMTSADFPLAIGEFVQRRMVPGYQQVAFNFEQFTKMDTTPNYLPVQRYQRRSELDDLEYTGKKATPRPGSSDDATPRDYQVYDWQKMFDFDFHALVNDDLGYFDEMATMMGRSARRTLEKFVSRMYTNITSVNRLQGLGALYYGTGRLTASNLDGAQMAFNQRRDNRGERIRANMAYVIHPSASANTVRTIRSSQLLPGTDLNDANIMRAGWTPVEDPYLDGTAPNLPWIALTNYRDNNVVPFVLARRSGVPAPMLLRKKTDMETFGSLGGSGTTVSPLMGDFLTGNMQIKVWDVWGTYIDPVEGNLFDVNGAYYSAGTTP